MFEIETIKHQHPTILSPLIRLIPANKIHFPIRLEHGASRPPKAGDVMDFDMEELRKEM